MGYFRQGVGGHPVPVPPPDRPRPSTHTGGGQVRNTGLDSTPRTPGGRRCTPCPSPSDTVEDRSVNLVARHHPSGPLDVPILETEAPPHPRLNSRFGRNRRHTELVNGGDRGQRKRFFSSPDCDRNPVAHLRPIPHTADTVSARSVYLRQQYFPSRRVLTLVIPKTWLNRLTL